MTLKPQHDPEFRQKAAEDGCGDAFDGQGFNYHDEHPDVDFWVRYDNIGSLTYIEPQSLDRRPDGEWHICKLSTLDSKIYTIELHKDQFDLAD